MSEIALTERERLSLAHKVIGDLPQLKIDQTHHFAQGVYARGGVIPKGSAFVGRVHKQSQINIISKGDITVLMETGIVRLIGPCTWVSPPGAQRAAYAHEDTYWTTIIGTDMTDPDEIYNSCTTSTYEDFQLVMEEIKKLSEEKSCS